MSLWYRVFAATDALPSPDEVSAHLTASGLSAEAHFRVEPGAGWFVAELSFASGEPVLVERFLADEDGIRAELNSWAASLEAFDSPPAAALMEKVVQARQLFTLRGPEGACVVLCLFLATATDGFWQADDRGFFAAAGTLLVEDQ